MGEVKFPEDSVLGWKLLLFWILGSDLDVEFQSEGNEDEKQHLLIQGWNLGDKYRINVACNEIIVELMLLLQRKPITPQNAKVVAAGSVAGSKLRKLVSHEIVNDIYGLGRRKTEDFEDALAVPGFAGEVLAALHQLDTDRQNFATDYVGSAGDGVRKEG